MRLSDLKAGSGEKRTLLLPVASPYPVEMTVICGCRPGKTLVVTAGVHGCEYVGIEALNRLKQELAPSILSGRVVLLPLINPEGFYQGCKQTIPTDGQNLNRMFPGRSDGTFSSQLARVLEETLYPEADFLMDLHGGDVNEALTPLIFFPAAVSKTVSSAAFTAAKALSVPYRVASTSGNGLYSWAAKCGIPSLLVERGERGLWSEHEISACMKNVYELMQHLGILDANLNVTQTIMDQIEIHKAIYEEASGNGFWYPAVSEAGHLFSYGEPLGILKDFHGNELSCFIAPFDGVVLYYTLSLGVKTGDPLIAYGKI